MMPRVVSNQKAKFENDELFRKLSRESEVRYTDYRDRPLDERQLRFQADCREGHAAIAFVATGTNLHLEFSPSTRQERTDEQVNFSIDPGKVHMKSRFILNGVCVKWRGWIDLISLDGIGHLQFDDEQATAERASFQEQKVGYSKRLESFQDRQGIYRLEQVDDGREGFGDYDTISETANEG